MRAVLLIVIASFFSCSPQRKLKKLLKKHPDLIKVSSDTVFVQDTTIIENVFKDSIFSISRIISSKDTIIYTHDRLTQKIYYKNDSIYLSGECESDTIVKEIPRYITKTEIRKPLFGNRIGGMTMVFILLLLGLFVLRKISN